MTIIFNNKHNDSDFEIWLKEIDINIISNINLDNYHGTISRKQTIRSLFH